ncbi:MAG: plasmid pRiA4b ORF-3 family protein [Nanoarchaeota archaeon]|nr:plasmid pRiA4b ORF-3 family protein [Nanoarchaeota archaeon]
MNKEIRITKEELDELKKQTKDEFTHLFIEDFKKKLNLKGYKESYKKMALNRILNLIEKEKIRKKLKENKSFNYNCLFNLEIIKRSGKKRSISIGGNSTLKELNNKIQKEFDLEPMHLYEFEIGNFKFGPECDEWNEIFDGLDNFKVGAAINSASLSKNDNFKFLYDFGSNIKFNIKILDIKDGK